MKKYKIILQKLRRIRQCMSDLFRTISSVEEDRAETWQDKIFLTFDIDWAHDDILNDTVDLVESYNVPVTWFVTHDAPVLNRLRDNPRFELGIHPNFNFLLQGSEVGSRSAEEVIEKALETVPEARSVRCHSMAQSSVILNQFKEHGLEYDCNHFIPWHSGIDLRPWKHWNGLIKVPYFWEDDVACIEEDDKRLVELGNLSGLKVFDFHPTQVFLNTKNIELYERTRPLHNNPKELIKHRYEKSGTRNRLLELLSFA